jgi:hypothetical protein
MDEQKLKTERQRLRPSQTIFRMPFQAVMDCLRPGHVVVRAPESLGSQCRGRWRGFLSAARLDALNDS